jgi:acetyl-CoA carboxylase carboxyltransferase component
VSRTTRWALQSRLTTSSALGLTICHSSRVGVRAATGEIVTTEELGDAEVHSRVSGVTDHYALDDRHALGIARLIVGNLNRTKNVSLDLRQPCEPVYPAEEIYGVIPPDTRRPYEVREVIARIVDGRCSPADPARASRRSRSPQRSR